MNAVRALAGELGWKFLARGEASDALSSDSLLVVLAPQWSRQDFDLLRGASGRVPEDVIQVQITDIDFLLGLDQYQRVLPRCRMASQTPVIAYYKKGTLVELWEGPEAARKFPDPPP